MKAAKAMEAAANNPSGMAGTGVGMGAGFAMANQMAQTMGQQQQAQAQQGTPPPLNAAVSFFVAQNGQQTGPFDKATLKQMATNGQLQQDSLVWKNGMSGWEAAGSQAELNDLWGQTPPPLPQL